MANTYVRYPASSGGGVGSLNSLTGTLTLAAGTNISITPSGGDTLTIAATGSSFTQYSYSYADFADPGTAKTINLGPALPANAVVQNIIVKPTQVFIGGANTSATLSVGSDAFVSDAYIAPYDVYSTSPVAPDNAANFALRGFVPSHTIFFGVQQLTVSLETDAANDQLTQGSIDIYVQYSTLP